jgi:uncharacterized protein (TIGR04141 family)
MPPKSGETKLRALSVFLVKPDRTIADALRDRDVRSFRVPQIEDSRDSLFLTSSVPKPPPWVAFLAPHASEPIADGLINASTSAVLFVTAASRLFAITFGYGRHLLHPEECESDFGLKVVLNSVAPDQLKSVDAKTVDDITLHTRRDVSRDASLTAFGLDISRDLLRAVTGVPRDSSLGPRLTGANALGLRTRAQVPKLPDLCETLLERYQALDYRAEFAFVDDLRRERDRVQELEENLVTSLRNWTLDDLHLAAPEPLDWLEVDGFRFSTQSRETEVEADPRISSYLHSLGDREVTMTRLRSDRVVAVGRSDGAVLHSWSVYRCIVFETQVDDHLYILSTGDWYRVSTSFKDDVHAFVNSIARPALALPAAVAGTKEADYNRHAAETLDALCLDQKLIADTGPDKMELCDILTSHGQFLHIKHRGSSSTLSHLFAQGLNSAERLIQDPSYRGKARSLIARERDDYADVVPEAVQARNHEITFVIITRSTRDTPLTLPFFSLVSLRAATRRLQTLGFPVSATTVQEASN